MMISKRNLLFQGAIFSGKPCYTLGGLNPEKPIVLGKEFRLWGVGRSTWALRKTWQFSKDEPPVRVNEDLTNWTQRRIETSLFGVLGEGGLYNLILHSICWICCFSFLDSPPWPCWSCYSWAASPLPQDRAPLTHSPPPRTATIRIYQDVSQNLVPWMFLLIEWDLPNTAPENRQTPKRKGSYSNHHFSRAYVSFREGRHCPL